MLEKAEKKEKSKAFCRMAQIVETR